MSNYNNRPNEKPKHEQLLDEVRDALAQETPESLAEWFPADEWEEIPSPDKGTQQTDGVVIPEYITARAEELIDRGYELELHNNYLSVLDPNRDEVCYMQGRDFYLLEDEAWEAHKEDKGINPEYYILFMLNARGKL